MMKLYKHQARFSVENPNVALLVWGLGSGKTRSACEWAKTRPAPLIVCPKGLKENWRRECEKWGLRTYTIISKEDFKKRVLDYHQKTLIVDESDHFYSAQFKSALAKAMKYYVRKHNPHRLFLTGTPYRSSAWNVYSAIWFLGVDLGYQRFKLEHFQDVRMGFRMIPVPRKGSPEKVRALINKYADVFNPEDDFDIPEQVDETIYTGESKSQEVAHRDNIEILPIVRFTRDHQIEAGIGCATSTDNKLDRIVQMALDVDKLAVVCRYRAQLETYARRLRDEGHTVFEMHGDIEAVERSLVLDKVELIKRCVLMVQSATVEGYEAPSIGVIVFASLDYSYRNYVQCRGRFLRMNRLKKNVYVHLIAGEADQAVMDSMSAKRDFDVLAYYKNKKGK